MKTRTITLTVSAGRDAVFAFLASLENLPVWAPRWCASLRREGVLWRGATLGGDSYFGLEADDRTGVIDLFWGEMPDEMSLTPIRIVSQPHGSVILCTFLQPLDCPDELYELYYEILVTSLRSLILRFGGGRLQAGTSDAEPFYPSLVTGRFFETWDFYTMQLGFRTVYADDFYVQLAHACGAQIGVLRHELDGPRPELVSATDGRGFWLNLDVPDADAEFIRLSAAGLDIVSPTEDKPWGDRQFVVRDPNGVLIVIAHRHEVRGMEARPLAVN